MIRPGNAGAPLDLTAGVVLDVRLASLALLCLSEMSHASLWAYALALSAVPLSFYPLRYWRRLGDRWLDGWWFPVTDSLMALALLMAFGLASSALLYVGATVVLAGLARSWRPTVLVLAPIVAAHAVALALEVHELKVGVVTGFAGRLILFGMVAWLAHRLAHLLREHDELRRQVGLARVEQGRAEERSRLSTEMHDSVAKTLHGLFMLTENLVTGLTAENHPLAPRAGVIHDGIGAARAEARALVADFRTPDAADVVPALTTVVDAWAEQHPEVDLDVSVPTQPLLLGGDTHFEMVRTVQECLENISRHAGADRVEVTVEQTPGAIEVTVGDDGKGFPQDLDLGELARNGHYGLVGMRDRLRRVNGSLTLRPRRGRGAEVHLRAPLALELEKERA